MRKTTVAALAAGVAFAASSAEMTRTTVPPVRVVAFEHVTDAEGLCGRRHGQVAEGEFLKGSGARLATNGWLVLDYGRELHGGLSLGCGARGGHGAKARVRFGESVAEALSPLGERGASNDHAIRDDVIALPWYGKREIGTTGFRFAYLANAGSEPLQIEFANAISVLRDMPRLGAFRCSDERINAVFETAVRTAELCCQDYLWDGIKRDRLVWMGDMHPETMTILSVFGAAEVLPASLDYMAATCAPDAWMNTMPTYTLWWIRNVAEWYRYTGDVAFLRRYRDYLSKTFDHVLTGMDGGRWTAGNFLDWPTKHNDAAATAGTQALALMTARETAFLAEALGDEALRAKARGMADALAASSAPDPHGAKSAAALLALSGLRPPGEMYASCLGRNGHAGVSTFYGYYMLEAMSAAGENRRALSTVRDYWGGMLDMGATSFWEDFNLAWTNNAFRIDERPVAGKKDVHGDFGDFCYVGFRHSLCHGWSSGPAAWLIGRVLGIRPLGVGSKRFELKPDLGDLEWAEGALALPGGRRLSVRVRRRADGTLEVNRSAPPDVVVETPRRNAK